MRGWILGLLALWTIFFLFASPHAQQVHISGLSISENNCAYFYQKWHHEPWFETWNWWEQNCFSYGKYICGNGVLEPGEQCDTSDPIPCSMLGFTGGFASCNSCKIDVSTCHGEGVVDYSSLSDRAAQLTVLQDTVAALENDLAVCMEESCNE